MKKMSKGTRFIAVLVVAMLVITGCSKKSANLKAGEYTVEVKGMKPMVVKVTLTETEIKDIEVVEHEETDGIADEALNEFPKRLIDSQDLTIDTVSGATITSNAVVDAVKKAIEEAGGDPASFGEVTGEVKFKPGTYKGVAEGHNGQIHVEIEVDEKAIITVDVKENAETEHLAKHVWDDVLKQIVDHQTLAVDAVTGATVTSLAVKDAVKDAVKRAGVDPRLLSKPVDKKVSTDVKEINTDVVVVGGGSAGLTAALTAKQQGKDVVVLEKNAMYGGHTALSGGWTLITGSKLQKEVYGITNDTVESAYHDVMANGGNHSDHDMLTLFVEKMGAAADWTVDYVGAEVPETLKALPENEIDRAMVYVGGGSGITDALVNKMDETDIKQYLDTKVEKLITEGDEVVGVEAKAKDGTTYKVMAESVILATGGHGARRDLLGKDLDKYVYYGASLASGDGVDLGTSVGGQPIDMSYVEIFENGVEWKPGIAKSTFNGSMAAWETGGILVDRSGKRVVNEKGMGPDIVAQQAKQDDARLFMFMDQSTFDAFRENVGGYGISDQMLEGWLENNGKNTPYFAHGKTIDEVSKIINIDANNLKKTVERYNGFVESGVDEDFGRDAKYMSQKIGDGPYYLVEQVPRYATTLGGLKVNTDLQVLNKDGQAIKGLYAIGDSAAGVRGDNSISGSDVAWAITSGYVIGEVLGK